MPALRFDFDSDWNETPLSSLLTFNNGINASKDSYGHGRKFINVLDILNNEYILYDDIIGSVNVSERQEEVSKVEYGDMLFLRSSETREDVGKSSTYLDENEYALFGGFVIRGKKVGDYEPYFLKLLLDTSSAREQISSKAGGSTRYNVSQGILNSVNLYMPSLEEQHKIATFFSLLDQKIAKQREKIKQLEQFKKGVMQRIFSQEIRFTAENGQEFPEWEEVSLGEVATITGGGTPPTNEGEYWNGDVPWFTPTEISLTKYVSKSKRTISEAGLTNSSAKLLPAGTVLLTTRATLGEMAIATVPVTTNQGFQSLVPRDCIKGEFLYYLQDLIKLHCLTYSSGSTFLEISKTNLEKFTFMSPSLQEQTKIISFFSTLDKKLEAERAKNSQMDDLKRGLMNQMFV